MSPVPPPERLDVVVVGHGMAAGRLVEELLTRREDGRAVVDVRITVVGAEPYGAYNRVLLTDVVAGRADVAALGTGDPDRLRERGVEVLPGTPVTAIDLDAAAVQLADGTRRRFDRLVLATGAEPVVPAETGGSQRRAGVHVLRTLDDAREIVAAIANSRRAVVLGGGLLGLEAAQGLARRGLDVTVVQAGATLLPGVLDAGGAEVLRRGLRRLGVHVRGGSTVSGLVHDGGRLAAVRLSYHAPIPAAGAPQTLECDLLLVACGVRPRTELAEAAGLAVGAGIVVDDALTTSDPRVLAIGDCAEHAGRTQGLVAPAWDQARIAADLISGSDPGARYHWRPPAIRLKAAGVDVAAAGERGPDGVIAPEVDPDGDGTEVVQLLDPARGHYVKAVVRDGVVVGALVVGDARAAAELTLMVDRGAPVPADRAVLVLPGARNSSPDGSDDPTKVPDGATICRCNGVTKRTLVQAWSAGADTRERLAAATRATTGCGTCAGAVNGILDWLRRADAGARPAPAGRVRTPAHDSAPDPSSPLESEPVASHGGQP